MTKFAEADKAYKKILKIREKLHKDLQEAPVTINARANDKISAVLDALDGETRALVEGSYNGTT